MLSFITPRIFYKKPKITACIPSNNVDSEGSSSSGDETENFVKESSTSKKKKLRNGCIVPIEESDSDNEDSDRELCDCENEQCDRENVLCDREDNLCDRESDFCDSESELCGSASELGDNRDNKRDSGNNSDSSEMRWSRKGVVDSDLVVPESDRSGCSSPVCSIASDMSSIKEPIECSPPAAFEPVKNDLVNKRTNRFKKPSVKVVDRYEGSKQTARVPLQGRQVNRNIFEKQVNPNKPFGMKLRRVSMVQVPSKVDHPSTSQQVPSKVNHPGASRLKIGLSRNVKPKQVLSAQNVLATVACKRQLPSHDQGKFIHMIKSLSFCC